MELIESIAPAQIFMSAPGFDEYTVAEATRPIHSGILTIIPQYTFEDCPRPEVIVVPGGPAKALRSAALKQWLQASSKDATIVMSVCNGALVLANAGLLDGIEATAPLGALDELMILGHGVKLVPKRRWQDSGKIVTVQSYFAAVDGALHVIERLRGDQAAKQVAGWNGYDWRPDEFSKEFATEPRPFVSKRFLVFEELMNSGEEAAIKRLHRVEEPDFQENSEALVWPDRLQDRQFLWLVGTLQDVGRLDDALNLCRFLVTAFPDSAPARARLAQALLAADQCDSALNILLEAHEKLGTQPDVLEAMKAILGASKCTANERSRVARTILRDAATASAVDLAPPDESGPSLVVEGTVRDSDKRPVADASIYVFHADAKGEYTSSKAMDEPNSRLFGFLKSGSDGRFRFRTVRPGGYTQPYKGHFIPEHIHFEVSAPGFAPRRFQLVFDDDPRIADEHWRKWAADQKNPVAKVMRDADGAQRCVCDIGLER